MADFQLYNPGVVADPIAEEISKLSTKNSYLTINEA